MASLTLLALPSLPQALCKRHHLSGARGLLPLGEGAVKAGPACGDCVGAALVLDAAAAADHRRLPHHLQPTDRACKKLGVGEPGGLRIALSQLW